MPPFANEQLRLKTTRLTLKWGKLSQGWHVAIRATAVVCGDSTLLGSGTSPSTRGWESTVSLEDDVVPSLPDLS